LGFKAAPQSSHHLKTVYQFSIAAVYQFTTAADSTKDNGTEVFLRPELLWELDDKGTWQLGLRAEMHRYKLNGQAYSRHSPSLMLKWTM
jgi:hypothetical protein